MSAPTGRRRAERRGPGCPRQNQGGEDESPVRRDLSPLEIAPFRPRSFGSIFPSMPAPRKPGRPTRAKASRPDLQPLDEHLAALLNPALAEPRPTGFGEAPQPRFESPAPESHPRGLTGASASADSLKALLDLGDPNIRSRPPWVPHRPPRPDKSEGGRAFRVVSEYEPKGDQPQAIEELVKGVLTTKATRCCSASPARERPSPWPR